MSSASPTLIIAISFIFAALAFYTVGVWAERIGGRLRWWHALVFWLGLVCDSTGTGAMAVLAGGMFQSTIHGITGMTAIVLMLFHAIWATIVLARRDEKAIRSFHRFSIFVWLVWLVPMIGGAVLGSSV
ncbi:MAG TPA: HsmA family protein [Rectinemataceae bacterium]|nr:HsmA family protein [Rectinemataceae bacterium]